MGVTKSYKRDVQILMKILSNQDKIKDVLTYFGCNQNNML